MFSANPAFADEEGTPEPRESKRSKSGREVGLRPLLPLPHRLLAKRSKRPA